MGSSETLKQYQRDIFVLFVHVAVIRVRPQLSLIRWQGTVVDRLANYALCIQDMASVVCLYKTEMFLTYLDVEDDKSCSFRVR